MTQHYTLIIHLGEVAVADKYSTAKETQHYTLIIHLGEVAVADKYSTAKEYS